MEDSELTIKFAELVGESDMRCKEIGLTYIRTKIVTRGATLQPRDAVSTTKKETVMLLTFCGDKKRPT